MERAFTYVFHLKDGATPSNLGVIANPLRGRGLRYDGHQRSDPRSSLAGQHCRYEEVTCQTGTDKSLTFENGLDRRQQFARRIRFDHIALGPRAQCFFRNVRGTILTDKKDFGIR